MRDIFRRYLRLKSVNAVRDELARDRLRSKAWTTAAGRPMGGVAFNSGSLFHLLQSRVYIGEIVHGPECYPGAHEAIVDTELFEAVQAQLAANTRQRKARQTKTATLPLQGIIFDAAGNRMSPTIAYGKSGRRYAYYVSAPLQRSLKLDRDMVSRLPAKAFQALLLERLRAISAMPDADLPELLPLLRRVDVGAQELRLALDRTALGGGRVALSHLQSRLAAGDQLEVDTRNRHTLHLILAVRPVFRGGRTWMVQPNGQGAATAAKPDPQLLKALAQAHAGLTAHSAGPSLSLEQWRRARAVPDSFLRRLVRLGFLAPDIQQAILQGRQPAGLSAHRMLQGKVSLAWADQRAAFGF